MDSNPHDDGTKQKGDQKGVQKPDPQPPIVKKKPRVRKLIFRSTVAVIFLSLAQFFNSPGYRFLCLTIGIVFVCSGLRLELLNHEDKKRRATGFSIGLFIVAELVVTFVCFWQPMPKKQIPDSLPSLEPTLVIDSVTTTNTYYCHWEICNKGSASARNIEIYENRGDFSAIHSPLFLAQNEIQPNYTQTVDCPDPSATLAGYYMSMQIILSYSDGAVPPHSFCQEFDFSYPKTLVKPGPLHPTESRITEWKRDIISSNLSKPAGTVFLTIAETNASNGSVQARYGSPRRFLIFDMVYKRLTFVSLTPDGRWLKASTPVTANTGRVHLIIAAWHSNQIAINVDGGKFVVTSN